MSGSHLRLVLNGKSAQREDVRAAVGKVRDAGHEVSVRVTWEDGDTERLTREALALASDDGIDCLVAGGGDGTVNAVVSTLHGDLAADDKPPFALAVLPLGTANDFACGMGLDPQDLTACLKIAAEADAKPTDIGVVNGRAFVNMATGGFGASVTTETDPRLKKTLGGAAYLFTGLNRFAELDAHEGRIEGDGFSWEGAFLALAIGNGRQAGGGFQLCPDADLNDGKLDLTIIPAPQATDVPDILGRLLQGGLEGLRGAVVKKQLAELTIHADQPLQINLDGEPLHSADIEVAALQSRIVLKRP
ncbi:lipid kinase YegS [Roseibium aggregatum]|uniref:Lipid kinase YegS n=1 Tax=Roseibium aggregatum TaxID=187304 RepID=A0A926S858_9HYPH|nr:lipid kinase YegS [Roseibium aggregatum]MBD1548317.1 lipid kinase YegS [Roseibium aggregatum]